MKLLATLSLICSAAVASAQTAAPVFAGADWGGAPRPAGHRSRPAVGIRRNPLDDHRGKHRVRAKLKNAELTSLAAFATFFRFRHSLFLI